MPNRRDVVTGLSAAALTAALPSPCSAAVASSFEDLIGRDVVAGMERESLSLGRYRPASILDAQGNLLLSSETRADLTRLAHPATTAGAIRVPTHFDANVVRLLLIVTAENWRIAWLPQAEGKSLRYLVKREALDASGRFSILLAFDDPELSDDASWQFRFSKNDTFTLDVIDLREQGIPLDHAARCGAVWLACRDPEPLRRALLGVQPNVVALAA